MTDPLFLWHGLFNKGDRKTVTSESGNRLRRARERAGFKTASEAAREFDWNPSTYRAHENGQNGISEDSARRYAEKFKVDWEWLVAVETQDAPTDIKADQSVFKGKWKVRPDPAIWTAAISTALFELGVCDEKSHKVTELVLAVVFAQLPAGLGLTEEELAQHLVQTGMRKNGLSIR